MRKFLFAGIAVALGLVFTSCGTSKKTVSVNDLNGRWNIVAVNGESVPETVVQKPYLLFDVSAKKIHGHASCNIMNGGFTQDKGKTNSILFSPMATTMMACPNMEFEGKVLKAMESVKTFQVVKGTTLLLVDESGKTLFTLTK